MLENGEIVSATIEQNQETPSGSIQFQTEDGATGRVNVSDVVEAENELKAQGVTITVNSVSRDNLFFSLILPVLLVGLVVIIFMSMMNRSAGGGRQYQCQDDEFRQKQSQNDNGSGQKKYCSLMWQGLSEEKEDLVEIVDFLKNPQKYIRVRSQNSQGCAAGGASGNGKDAAGQGGSRRSRSAVFLHIRFGFCGNVCRCRRFPCP